MSGNINNQDIQLEKDLFLRSVLRELMGTLENVIGTEQASGYISVVGQHLGDWINQQYRQAFQTDSLSNEQIQHTLVDLKQRIDGDFYIVSADKEKIVLGNRRCPFGDKVKDRPSLCMMTSNVFGTITAENNGYARVDLKETIARGDKGCHVVVYLNDKDTTDGPNAREYYKS